MIKYHDDNYTVQMYLHVLNIFTKLQLLFVDKMTHIIFARLSVFDLKFAVLISNFPNV